MKRQQFVLVSLVFLSTGAALVEGVYLGSTLSEVQALRARLEKVPAQEPARPLPGEAAANARIPRFNPVAPAAPPDPEQLRIAVAAEVRAQREREEQAQEQHREEMYEQGRQAVARAIDLSSQELARLEELSARLREAELQGSQRPTLEEDRAKEQRHVDIEREVRRLLGEDRYAKFLATRRDHPELARSLAVLQSPPLAVVTTAPTNPTDPVPATR
jgi:hypothetical protein